MASSVRDEEEVACKAGQPWSSVSNSEENLSGGSGARDLHAKDERQQEEEPRQREAVDNCDDSREKVVAKKEIIDAEEDVRGVKRGRVGHAKNGGSGGESDHEMHIWTERERRKKMRNMFSSLHALLPHLPLKADKSTIVDEAVSYIKRLQQTLQGLQKQKLERLRGASLVSVVDNQSPPLTTEISVAPTTVAQTTTREAFIADVIKKNNIDRTTLLPVSSPTAVPISRLPLVFQTWSSPSAVLNVSGDDAFINFCAAKKPGLLQTVLFFLDKHKLEVISASISSDCFRSMFMIHARQPARLSDQFSQTLMMEDAFKLAVGEILAWISSQYS